MPQPVKDFKHYMDNPKELIGKWVQIYGEGCFWQVLSITSDNKSFYADTDYFKKSIRKYSLEQIERIKDI